MRHTSALMLVLMLLWGCRQGYPSHDLVDGGLMSPADHVVQLNDLSTDVARKVRQHILLVEDCLLRFTSAKEASATPASVDVALLDLDLTMSTDSATRNIAIAVQTERDDDALSRTVYETSLWHHAVAFRSHLLQLQRLCAETQAPA